MRTSNHAVRGRRLSMVAVGALAMIIAACGSSTTTPPPSVVPTPSPTPDPHLMEPVTADQIYTILFAAKLDLSCPNANLGNGNPRIVKQINCTVGGWPLRIVQYTSESLLTSAVSWKSGEAPRGNEAPYNWAGLNILITLGPISARAPSTIEPARQATAAAVFAVLDPLLWPIAQHSVVAIPGRTPPSTPAPSASSAPSKAPAKSPKPKPSKSP